MAHKIRAVKISHYDDEYRSNKKLLTLLAIGLPCAIIYMSLYFYNFYQILFVDHTGQNITIPSDSVATLMVITWFGYFISFLLSQIFLHLDLNKLNVGLAFESEKFRSITWNQHSWRWLTFFFWWFIFPLYLYRRQEIYQINKAAMNRLNIKPEPVQLFSRRDAIILVILIIIIFVSLAVVVLSG